jgi:hypothetical protein
MYLKGGAVPRCLTMFAFYFCCLYINTIAYVRGRVSLRALIGEAELSRADILNHKDLITIVNQLLHWSSMYNRIRNTWIISLLCSFQIDTSSRSKQQISVLEFPGLLKRLSPGPKSKVKPLSLFLKLN